MPLDANTKAEWLEFMNRKMRKLPLKPDKLGQAVFDVITDNIDDMNDDTKRNNFITDERELDKNNEATSIAGRLLADSELQSKVDTLLGR